MIDICDFAVGQSRKLYGKTMPSERPGHRLMETWHPLGVGRVISAFNFPVAVYSWNTALALVCGDTVVWKPSGMTPLTALAADALFGARRRGVWRLRGHPPAGHRRPRRRPEARRRIPGLPLVSATGSSAWAAQIAPRVAARFGRSLLELGGNNAAIIAPTRRPGAGDARHRVRRRRHRRPALHHHAPADRPRIDRRRADRRSSSPPTSTLTHRRPAGRRRT